MYCGSQYYANKFMKNNKKYFEFMILCLNKINNYYDTNCFNEINYYVYIIMEQILYLIKVQ